MLPLASHIDGWPIHETPIEFTLPCLRRRGLVARFGHGVWGGRKKIECSMKRSIVLTSGVADTPRKIEGVKTTVGDFGLFFVSKLCGNKLS